MSQVIIVSRGDHTLKVEQTVLLQKLRKGAIELPESQHINGVNYLESQLLNSWLEMNVIYIVHCWS